VRWRPAIASRSEFDIVQSRPYLTGS
jgi:hypothetical protein